MRTNQPPRIASWLLRHFGSSPNNDAVMGDLNGMGMVVLVCGIRSK